jgi:hypothetical protein
MLIKTRYNSNPLAGGRVNGTANRREWTRMRGAAGAAALLLSAFGMEEAVFMEIKASAAPPANTSN